MKRYEHHLVDDEQSLAHGTFVIIDNKIGRGIGHIRLHIVAEQIVNELNKMETQTEKLRSEVAANVA